MGTPLDFGPEVDRSFGDDGALFVGIDSVTVFSSDGGMFISNGVDDDETTVTSYDDAGSFIGSVTLAGGGRVFTVDPDDRAIVGTTLGGGTRLHRILPDGTDDPDFRSGLGSFPQPPGPDPDGYVLYGALADSAGRIYLAFRASDPFEYTDHYVTRTTPDGLFSVDFGATSPDVGWVNVGNLREMRVTSDDRLLTSVATLNAARPFNPADSYRIDRWLTNGLVDPTFATIDSPAPESFFYFVALSDGTIVTEQNVGTGEDLDIIRRSVYDASGAPAGTSTFESYASPLFAAPGASYFRIGPEFEQYELVDANGDVSAGFAATGGAITANGAPVSVQLPLGANAFGQLNVLVLDYANDRFYISRFAFRTTGPAPDPVPIVGPTTRSSFIGDALHIEVSTPGLVAPNVKAVVTSGPHAGTRFDCLFGCLVLSRLSYIGTSPGIDRVVVYDDLDDDDMRDPDEPATSIEVTWFDQVDYVALGDSFSSGEGLAGRGAGLEEWLPGYDGRRECHRSELAYGPRLSVQGPGAFPAIANPAVDFSFLACTGARTYNIVRDLSDLPNFPGDGDSIESAGGPAPGIGGERQGQSLEEIEILDGDVELITLTMGGNDSNWAEIVAECFLDDVFFTNQDCFNGFLTFPGTEILLTDYIEDRIVVVAERTRATLLDLKATAPDATIVLAGYPYLVPETLEEQECSTLDPPLFGERYLSPTEQNKIRGYQKQLDDLMIDVAADVGVHYVSVLDAFAGHEVCGGDGEYINGLIPDLSYAPPRFPNPGIVVEADPGTFHPKAAGHEAYRTAIERYLDAERLDGNFGTAGIPANPEPRVSEESFAPVQGFAGAVGVSSAPRQVPPTEGVEFVPLAALEPQVCEAAPVVVAPGSSFQLGGLGFDPGSSVTLTAQPLLGADIDLGIATADSAGELSETPTLPASVASGDTVSILAVGTTPAGIPAIGRAQFLAGDGGQLCTENDEFSTLLDTPAVIDVLANDDPGGAAIDPSTLDVEPGTVGSASVENGQIVYSPASGFVGVDHLEYTVCRVDGVCSNGTAMVEVAANCTIVGTNGDDVLVGTEGDDVICGLYGSDSIDGRGGDDTLIGGPGIDYLVGGGGADRLLGGDDTDYFANDADDTIDAEPGELDQLGDVYPPTVTGTVAPAANAAGWHNSAVTVTWSVDDREPSSGPSTVPPPTTVSVEGASIEVVSDESCDPGGNCAIGSVTVSIDLTAPTVTVEGVDDGQVVGPGDPFPSPTCEATDALSGLTGPCTGVLEQVPGSDTDWTFTASATDNADNASSVSAAFSVATEEPDDPCAGLVPTIVGTEGDDVLQGTWQDDVIFGLGGDDVINGASGSDIICGGPGDDVINGQSQNDTIYGGAGADTIDGASGSDTIDGGPGDDDIDGGSQDDSLDGGAGDDTIEGASGADTIRGGDGADTLTGSSQNDVVHGGDGDDSINGGPGADTLDGGNGFDVVDGSWQVDTCDDAEQAPNCEVVTFDGEPGDPPDDPPAPILCQGLVATIVGTDGDDVLQGTWQDDVIVGLGGNDTIDGASGSDTICAGDGDDVVDGGSQDDSILGEGGEDLIDGESGADVIDGGAGNDDLRGASQDDTIRGGDGDDVIDGGSGADDLDGGSGVDVVDGSWQNDTCRAAETAISCETIIPDDP